MTETPETFPQDIWDAAVKADEDGCGGDMAINHIAKAILAERIRCADIAKRYQQEINDCSPNEDEPEKVYEAIMTGKMPFDE
jgi:hypothetical protein